MKTLFVVDEDVVNYKKTSMFLGVGVTCTFKCGKHNCQNAHLHDAKHYEINNQELIKRYLDNPITSAVVIGGLEPFDNFIEMLDFIHDFRLQSDDDIVIYTGYNKEEIDSQVKQIIPYGNLIIKYGRYLPDLPSYLNTDLMVVLASENQYTETY